MTDETFTELVNLYLDKEISEKDLRRLKAELSADARRRRLFVERSRLHTAMQLALNPQAGAAMEGVAPKPSSVVAFDWFMGTGLAAALVLGVVFLTSSVWDRVPSPPFGNEAKVSSFAEPDFLEQALSEWNGDAELKRYASRQQQGLANERASFAAQLRLMGLRPELTPQDKVLRAVDLAALETEPTRSQAELLSALQRNSVMPEARILRYDAEMGSNAENGSPETYGSGFQSSLISFR